MHKYIIIIATILLFNNITAQNTINGSVKDQKTGEPLMGVTVLVENTDKGTTTDFNGNFMLSFDFKSDFIIIASYTGFVDEKISINTSNTENPITILLHEKVLELDEVILSTPFNKLQSENVVKVSYKSVASMQKRGIQNLMDGVSQISGVTQMSTGSGISKPVIRGLTGSRVLVYNQGVRLENFQFGEVHGIGINESGIGSVEVIKGPASLLYGSDAVGGVLYLVPEKYAPKGETKVDLNSKYTSNTLGSNTTIGIKTSLDKLQFIARVAYNTNADYTVANGKRVTNSRYNDKDLKLGLGYKGKILKTDIRFNTNLSQNGIPNTIGIQETSRVLDKKHQNLDNQVLSVKNDFKLANSTIKTNIGHTWHNRKLIIEEATKIGMQLNTLNYDVKWYLPSIKKLESIIGLQGMNQKNTNFGENYLLPDATTNSIGAFTTLNYNFNNLTLQGGVRYDARHIVTQNIGEIGASNYRPGFDKNLGSFTTSLGFKTNVSDKITARLNIATGFRAPNLSELASKGIHSGRIEIGNDALKNEKNWQADLALEYAHTHVEFFANAFINTINDYIFLSPLDAMQGIYPVYQYQQDDAQLYGGEIGLHFHPHPYDWLHISSSYEMVIGKQKDETYLPLIPANQWKNQLRLTNDTNYKFLDKYYLNIGVNHTFKADKISVFEKEQTAYTLFNTSLGADFKFKKLAFTTTLSIHNIFDKEYISHLSVLREYEIPNMGRNVIFGVNVKF
ncbi:MAG TPA: TonB-dependent receptor [Lutibacter sp.]|nr:TonB-dependent receptor [Lutibacter sp.]